MKRLLGPILLAAWFFGCARLSPEMQVVHDAANALGGADKILAVHTLLIEGEGENFNLGQNMSPEAALPKFTVTGFKRSIDFQNRRWRQEQIRTPNFVTGNPPTRQVTCVDGDVAFNVSPTNEPTRAAEATAKDRALELYESPIAILQVALAPDAIVTGARKADGHDVVNVVTPAGALALHVDAATRLPVKVVAMTDNPVLGDVAMETEFGSYQETGGIKLPMQIISRTDGKTLAAIRVSHNEVNAKLGDDLKAPEPVMSAAAAPPVTVNAEEVAKGVWYLTGQTHHSVLVEFKDHLTLIEAPQNDARALAVIAKARELRPQKPLTELVATHHHFDHTGGVRAAISEGLTVIAQSGTRAFFEDVAARKHTIAPDALARSPKALSFQGVENELILKDDTMTVALYPIKGNPHADTLLMAYFPKERFLVQADVYNPPAPNAPPTAAFPFTPNLVENVQQRSLRVDKILPIHGRMVPMTDCMTAAKQPRQPTE